MLVKLPDSGIWIDPARVTEVAWETAHLDEEDVCRITVDTNDGATYYVNHDDPMELRKLCDRVARIINGDEVELAEPEPSIFKAISIRHTRMTLARAWLLSENESFPAIGRAYGQKGNPYSRIIDALKEASFDDYMHCACHRPHSHGFMSHTPDPIKLRSNKNCFLPWIECEIAKEEQKHRSR
tara:strand:+ start:5851 stop:6399 length:549 start_codon:yes stop_codon:yes gene_type:complete